MGVRGKILEKNDIRKEPEWIEIKVTQEGFVKVNSGVILIKHKDVVIVEMDLDRKYCEVDSTFEDDKGNIGIEIASSARTFDTGDEDVKSTMIEFPKHKGWKIWSYNIARYTLRLSLVKI